MIFKFSQFPTPAQVAQPLPSPSQAKELHCVDLPLRGQDEVDIAEVHFEAVAIEDTAAVSQVPTGREGMEGR